MLYTSMLMAYLNICPHRPCKKPLSPSCTVQMSDTKDSPVPIPLLAAALGADSRTVLLAYGNHLQPVMEKVVSTQRFVSLLGIDTEDWLRQPVLFTADMIQLLLHIFFTEVLIILASWLKFPGIQKHMVVTCITHNR